MWNAISISKDVSTWQKQYTLDLDLDISSVNMATQISAHMQIAEQIYSILIQKSINRYGLELELTMHVHMLAATHQMLEQLINTHK